MRFKKVIKDNVNEFFEIVERQISAFIDRRYPKPVYISNQISSKIKVHVGCGSVNLQGWINVDARALQHVHIVTDNLLFKEFTDGSIDEIYMCHILEHLSFVEASTVLSVINRKLKKGGVIRLSVPDFDSLVNVYVENGRNINEIKYALLGGQDYQFNYHKSVYNGDSLINLLGINNFEEIKRWEPLQFFGKDIGDWSAKFFRTSSGKVPVSLNLVAKSK